MVWVHNSNIFYFVTFFQSLSPIVQLSHLGRTFQNLGIVCDSAALLLHCASDIRPSFTLIIHMSPLNTASLVPQLYLLILQRELTTVYGYMSIIIIAQCLLAVIHLITRRYSLVPLLQSYSHTTSLPHIFLAHLLAIDSRIVLLTNHVGVVVKVIQISHLDFTDSSLGLGPVI